MQVTRNSADPNPSPYLKSVFHVPEANVRPLCIFLLYNNMVLGKLTQNERTEVVGSRISILVGNVSISANIV